jgi:hypothetical protein
MTATFIRVRVHRRSIGKECMHCGRSATVTALRVTDKGGPKMPVRYCAEHADLRGCVR